MQLDAHIHILNVAESQALIGAGCDNRLSGTDMNLRLFPVLDPDFGVGEDLGVTQGFGEIENRPGDGVRVSRSFRLLTRLSPDSESLTRLLVPFVAKPKPTE